MRTQKFRTQNDFFDHSKPLDTGKESKVETAGYISAKQRIENLLLAGQRLAASRSTMYDDPNGSLPDEDVPYDPTRDPGFDMADASKIWMEVDERMKKQKKAAEAAKMASEAPKMAQEEPKKEGGQ